MSKKNGFSMLETITPMVRLLPPARLRAWRFGWYFSSSMAFTTRARVEPLTTLALLSTRETVAVETLARLATCSRFMSNHIVRAGRSRLRNKLGLTFVCCESRTIMRAKSVFAIGTLSASLLSLTSCIVGVGDWERFSKDFHSSYPLKPGGRISVETFNGSVDISGWDQDTVDVSGTKFGPSQEDADNLRVDIDHSADSVSIHVQRPTDRRNNQGARLTIKIPRGTQLDRIVTSNSAIHTEDGAGPTHLRTSNGSIQVTSLHGQLEAETSNSSIELDGVDGNVRLHSSNGHIRAEHVNGSIDASTSN